MTSMNGMIGNSKSGVHNPARMGHRVLKAGLLSFALLSILGAATWSTYSLYTMLADNGAPHMVARVSCGVFDATWILTVFLVAGDKYGDDKMAQALSWATLAVSLGASGAHGYLTHSWMVGVFGVLLVLAAKGTTQIYISRMRPRLQGADAEEFRRMAYNRYINEMKRQHEAELAEDDRRWMVPEVNPVLNPQVPAQQPAPVQAPQTETVKVERVQEPEEDPFEIPAWVNSRPAMIEAPKPPVPAQPNLVPAESPKVPAPVQISSRQDRVNDLAKRIAENGGQLGSVTFAQMSEWYGIDASKKSTLSVLRKDAHQKYLDNATQGLYM